MKVSFICASYNYEKYIAETIESVIAQDVDDWELIVFDDGSKDSSIKIINEYVVKDDRVKLFVHKNNANLGLIATLKAAASVAESDWLAFIESDDILKPNYLSEKLKILDEYKDLEFIFSNVEILGSDKIKAEYANFFEKNKRIMRCDFNLMHFVFMNIVPTFSCVMIRKELFNSLDFNSPIQPILDWWLWAQVSPKHKIAYIDKELSIWRRHEGSYISTLDSKLLKSYSRSVFNFLFKSKHKFLPRLYIELYMLFNSSFTNIMLGTPSRLIRTFVLNKLNEMNEYKPSLRYFE